MHVISPKRIREAYARHPEWSSSLKTWLRISKVSRWKNSADIKQTWSKFEKVGNWKVFTITDGRLITGQNPASSGPAAKALIDFVQTG